MYKTKLLSSVVVPGDGQDREKGIVGFRVDVWQGDRGVFHKVTKILETDTYRKPNPVLQDE